MRAYEFGFDEANVSPPETGLPFTVWMSPRADARHGARIKATNPPWGENPVAVYDIDPFAFAEGDRWLDPELELQLSAWTDVNRQVLLDLWNGAIRCDHELRTRLAGIGDCPPGDWQGAAVALRAITPRVKAIHWSDRSYQVTTERIVPEAMVARRFAHLGFGQQVRFHTTLPNTGITLWERGPRDQASKLADHREAILGVVPSGH